MTARHIMALDIGSNSVGSSWLDLGTGRVVAGASVFPAGVDETDDKRGEPRNAKRRMTRRTRITLARRAARKRDLRLRLIEAGLLPTDSGAFKTLLETTDPWALRRKGLDCALSPFEFGRVLLHLAQRRGALGLKAIEPDEEQAEGADEDGKVRDAIGAVKAEMLRRKARTFGEFLSMVRDERVRALPGTDPRPEHARKGPREYREAIRNRAGAYEHCADRAMIRDEFARLWESQKRAAGPTTALLTDELRRALDDDSGDSTWRHGGLLFGQRRQTWDLGTLGRCVLEPTERCVPHADMHASRYLVVETVNNLKIIEQGREARPLTPQERAKIAVFLSGPLGMLPPKVVKGRTIPERPKATVTVTDLREFMGWGRAGKRSLFRFNIEADEDREINTDWFCREIVHGAVGAAEWAAMPERLREGINRAILRHDPEQDGDEARLKAGVMAWGGLNQAQADALAAAWRRRPKPDARRLNLSRRAVLTLLPYMERFDEARNRWVTQVEARLAHAEALRHRYAAEFIAQGMDAHAAMEKANQRPDVRRYATGAKGLSARDRHYLRKHAGDLPPAPMVSNPVVRKAIHEVRRHVIEHLRLHGRKPDEIYIELSREARVGAKDADRLLFRNRLRNRIRSDIIEHFGLHARTPSQQRAAIDRVVLCVQQGGVCPLCGNQTVHTRITPRMAADGEGCEVAHIIPRGIGGHNGMGNIVLSHTKCNRDMGRRTPRQFWSSGAGFDAGMRWVEGIYGEVDRPKFKEVKTAKGDALWACYFDKRDDGRKIDQFAKDIKDIQEMTPRQDAATKYAARQVMTYLADALFDGKGLPERGGERKIFATDGMWTSRLRREWGLFFDPHHARAKGLSNQDEHVRREKNRGDHRHHAIDAIVIGLSTRSVQIAWEQRERAAETAGINTADEDQMEAYRRLHPLDPPAPFTSREAFRGAVRAAVFGEKDAEKPISHRPVKRKLIGALHEETLFGPVLDHAGNLTGNYTAKKGVLALTPNHLRMPDGWDDPASLLEDGAVTTARKRELRRKLAAMDDPPPGKSGIVRDRALRNQIRRCLRSAGLDPDNFTANQIKHIVESGGIRHASGVPIRSVVLLRTMSDPVVIGRKRPDYATGAMVPDEQAASLRAYVGGNNHHIEIRAGKDKKGRDQWSGQIVTAFEAAQRKLRRLKALRAENIPRPADFRKLPEPERARLRPILAAIEKAHPLVNRDDDDALGGAFVMSLCEGEMLWMRHKVTDEPGYFVVAKLDKPRSIVLVPHWDARAAGERKDAEGKPIPDSARDQFSATPSDLARLAPPGHAHAVKVRVSPLGAVTILEKD